MLPQSVMPFAGAAGAAVHVLEVSGHGEELLLMLFPHLRGLRIDLPARWCCWPAAVPVRVGAGVCLAEVVLRGGRGRWGAGCRLVLWLGPKEPHCVVAVSGGRGGSPAAVPERWPVARVCGRRSGTAAA